jgi:hypothetical protein
MFHMPDAFDPRSKPEAFINSELRQRVEALNLEYRQPDETSQQPAKKRRKVVSSSATMSILSDHILEILNPEDAGSEGLPNFLK